MSAPSVRPPAEVARELFRRMLLVRRVEERIQRDYHRREMRSPPHLYMGHEAVAAGVCTALAAGDLAYPYYRSHGWYLAKGGDLKAMIAELHGRETGCSRGWGGSMHLIDLAAGVTGTSAIVGGTIPHAAGAALVMKLRRTGAVVAVSFGDAAVEEGVFHETLNFANLPRRKLPVVFVCENNLYATNTHIRERQAVPGIHQHAQRFGIPGVQVDGNDAAAVWGAARDAVDRARRGEGPSLVECLTYRYYEHCGINEDHELGYRTHDEVRAWRAKDCVERGRGLVGADEAREIEARIMAAIEEAFAWARSQPWPASLAIEGAAG
jgi:pyruvate dehydrogenase E1 component alpha subunit